MLDSVDIYLGSRLLGLTCCGCIAKHSSCLGNPEVGGHHEDSDESVLMKTRRFGRRLGSFIVIELHGVDDELGFCCSGSVRRLLVLGFWLVSLSTNEYPRLL